MLAALLAVKLNLPPPVPGLTARPALLQRLENGLPGRLTLVSAPPGFGKTTLAAGWLHGLQTRRGVGWLSLDEGDNLPEGFWMYAIAALQNAQARAAEIAGSQAAALPVGAAALAALQAEGGPRHLPVESILVSLLNDLAGLPAAPGLVLALDDYHTITNPKIHHALDFFIERLPASLHLLIATREDPPLALARLRARGQLNELRLADLRFTPQEAGQFLNQGLALDLAPEDVTALAERTEGWIAGLRLAAISLQSESDKHAFVGAFTASHRFLTDYLVDEVLSRLDPDLQTFLRRTSILRRFNPELCDTVVGRPGSQATLRRLEQANLFVAPLDNQRQWYRYHHLFAQFLRLGLLESEPDLLPELYRRAVAWCAGHGLEREALAYALEAGEQEQAAVLLERLAPQVLSSEGAAAVLQWMAALPERLVQAHPFLCVHYAWALAIDGQMLRSMELLAAAERLAGVAEPDPSGQTAPFVPLPEGPAVSVLDEASRQDLLGYIAAHRSYQLFFQGYFPAAIQYGRLALERLPAGAEVLRVRTATFLGAALRQGGHFMEAAAVLAQVEPVVYRTGSVYSANLYFDNLAEIYLDQGRLHQAGDIFRQALAFTRQQTGREDLPFSGFAFFALGALYHEWNDLAAAGEYMARGLALCREWRQADALAIGLIEQARLQQSQGAYDQARQSLDEVGQIVTGFSSPWGVSMVAAYRARLDLATGDLAAAGRWAQEGRLSPDEPAAIERALELETLARVLICQGEARAANSPASITGEPAAVLAAAAALLERMRAAWHGMGARWRELEALAWLARARAAQGAPAQALAALQAALALGEPEGFMRTLLDAGAPVAGLLAHLPSGAYRDLLLAAFEQEPGAPGESLTAIQTPGPLAGAAEPEVVSGELPPVEPLNPRELEVLRLLAAGRSNQEIAEALYLSVNTVRWYARQIYQKLGVGSRGAAVAHARRLGIIR